MKNAIITILVGIILVLIVLKFRGVSFFDAEEVAQMVADKLMRDQAKLAELKNQRIVTETRNQLNQKIFDDMLVKAQQDYNNQKTKIQMANPSATRSRRLNDLMAKQRAMEQKIMVEKENKRRTDTTDLMRLTQELVNQENVVRISIQEKEMADKKALQENAPILPEVMPSPAPAPILPEVMPPPIPAPILPAVMPPPIPVPILPAVMPAPAPMEKGYMGIGSPLPLKPAEQVRSIGNFEKTQYRAPAPVMPPYIEIPSPVGYSPSARTPAPLKPVEQVRSIGDFEKNQMEQQMKQREMEAQKQREMEAQKQREMEAQKQREMEQRKQYEMEAQKQEYMKKMGLFRQPFKFGA